jgi:hypothetical protein
VTLRARLLLAAAIVLITVIVGAMVIVRTQQDTLLSQLDDQLLATRPFLGAPGGVPISPPKTIQPDDIDEPISSLFVAAIDGGQPRALLTGQLLADTPDFEASGIDLAQMKPGTPFTVDGENGTMRFRAVMLHDSRTGQQLVAALPLDDIDSALGRLRWTLAGVTAAVTLALALSFGGWNASVFDH